jgi:hypothetical protein
VSGNGAEVRAAGSVEAGHKEWEVAAGLAPAGPTCSGAAPLSTATCPLHSPQLPPPLAPPRPLTDVAGVAEQLDLASVHEPQQLVPDVACPLHRPHLVGWRRMGGEGVGWEGRVTEHWGGQEDEGEAGRG